MDKNPPNLLIISGLFLINNSSFISILFNNKCNTCSKPDMCDFVQNSGMFEIASCVQSVYFLQNSDLFQNEIKMIKN